MNKIFVTIIFLAAQYKVIENRTMNALFIKSFGPPDILEIRQMTIPAISDQQVLIKVKATAICSMDELANNHEKYNKEIIPGKETSGIIEETGSSVSTLQKGDRVFCKVTSGAYAEYVRSNSSGCYKLPKNVTFGQGTALYDYFDAYKALVITGNIKNNETVLIHGAVGSFGIAAIQIAKAVGCYVVATVDSFVTLREIMRTAGADYVIHQNIRHYLEKALNKIRRNGFDVILEIPTKANLRRKKNCLIQSGRIIVFGRHVPATVSEDNIERSGGSVRTFQVDKYEKEEYDSAALFISNSVDNSHYINPIVRQAYKINEATKAHFDMVSEKSAEGKLILVFSD